MNCVILVNAKTQNKHSIFDTLCTGLCVALYFIVVTSNVFRGVKWKSSPYPSQMLSISLCSKCLGRHPCNILIITKPQQSSSKVVGCRQWFDKTVFTQWFHASLFSVNALVIISQKVAQCIIRASTRKVIFNLFYIYLVPGDIQDRPCKKT